MYNNEGKNKYLCKKKEKIYLYHIIILEDIDEIKLKLQVYKMWMNVVYRIIMKNII